MSSAIKKYLMMLVANDIKNMNEQLLRNTGADEGAMLDRLQLGQRVYGELSENKIR